MLPVTPTTSGSNRAAPGRRRSRGRRAAVAATSTTTSRRPMRIEPIRAARETRTAAAPRAIGFGATNAVAVGPLAGQGDEEVARDDLPRVDRGAEDGSVGAQRGAGRPSRRRGRRPSARDRRRGRRSRVAATQVGHGRPVSHTTPSPVGDASGRAGRAGREQAWPRDRVVGDPAEQLERHDRHLELADAGDRRRPLVDLHAIRRGPATPGSRPM